jgi:DNA-binding GntR family transcriptional regulator
VYAATRQTVRNAIDTLANEGLLRRAAGKGVFVPGSHVERDPEVPGGS